MHVSKDFIVFYSFRAGSCPCLKDNMYNLYSSHRTIFKFHFHYTIKKGLVPLFTFNGGPRLLLGSELRSSLANLQNKVQNI